MLNCVPSDGSSFWLSVNAAQASGGTALAGVTFTVGAGSSGLFASPPPPRVSITTAMTPAATDAPITPASTPRFVRGNELSETPLAVPSVVGVDAEAGPAGV